MTVITFHIRRRLAPKGGRPFYSGKNERFNGTHCGQDATKFDVANHEKPLAWTRKLDGTNFWPCLYCIEKRGKK